MTKGTKIFRIIICTLLALTMIIGAFFTVVLCLLISMEKYGIYVDGVSVMRTNKDDILGDGTVSYDDINNILVFNNATIESEDTVVYSEIDLQIELVGENRLICTNNEYSIGIYAGDYNLYKDLAIIGEGSLTIEMPNTIGQAVGISAANLIVAADLTVVTPNCEKMTGGIICDSSMMIVNKATVTVNNGAAKYCSAVRVRGNTLLEEGTALNVSVNPGCFEICKGLSISGDLLLNKETSLDVSIDDGSTDLGECIRVSGLMEIGIGSTVKASAKNAYAIECFSTIEANEGAAVSAVSDKKDADIFCSGAVINCGADINAEITAYGGIHNQNKN